MVLIRVIQPWPEIQASIHRKRSMAPGNLGWRRGELQIGYPLSVRSANSPFRGQPLTLSQREILQPTRPYGVALAFGRAQNRRRVQRYQHRRAAVM